jgi:hypothetical protein
MDRSGSEAPCIRSSAPRSQRPPGRVPFLCYTAGRRFFSWGHEPRRAKAACVELWRFAVSAPAIRPYPGKSLSRRRKRNRSPWPSRTGREWKIPSPSRRWGVFASRATAADPDLVRTLVKEAHRRRLRGNRRARCKFCRVRHVCHRRCPLVTCLTYPDTPIPRRRPGL